MLYYLKRLFLFSLILFFFSLAATAQVPFKIKFPEITVSKENLEKKMYYFDSLLLIYRKSNPDTALYFARKVKYFAEQIKDTASVDYAITHIGSIHRILGNYDSSIYYYKESMRRYRKRNFTDGMASIYSNLANVYKLQGRYDLAIKNYLEAADVFRKSKNHNALANVYSGLAGLYFRLENDSKAFEYWKWSEKEYAISEPAHHISHAYRGKTRVYIRKKQYDKAWRELKKAAVVDSTANVDVQFIETLLLRMELLLEDNEAANGFNRKSFEATSRRLSTMFRQMDMPMVEAKYHELMGDWYVQTFENEKALLHYDSVLTAKLNEDVPEMKLDVLRKKFKVQLSMKDYSLVIPFNILMQYEKEVAKIKRERVAQETDARYSLRDKEEKIKILNEKNEASQALVEKEKELSAQTRKQNVFLWSGIGLFLIFIFYILFINRKLKSTQKELHKNIEQKDYLFRELNHRVKNNLHIVGSFLSIESHGKSEEVKEILLTCENRIQSLGLVHEMLYKGDISENISVKVYFEKLVQVLKETLMHNDSNIIADIDPSIELSSNKMVLLGLIANELITNSLKYARTSGRKLTIQLKIHSQNGKIIMLVSDNGSGMNEQSLSKDSLGMKLAKGLSRQMEGDFTWQNLTQGVEFRLIF